MEDLAGAPLAEAQEGLWYAQRLQPDNPIFNTGQYLDLEGALDVGALQRAVAQAGREAETLSLRFTDGEAGPRQMADPALRPRLKLVDLSADADPEGAALAAIRQSMATVTVPESGPMARQTLYRLSATRHFWAQQVHHFAIDGYGMVLLTARIAELYGLFVVGKDGGGRPLAPLAPLLAEDERYRRSAEREADARFWKQRMAGMAEVAGLAPGRAQSAHGFHRFAEPLPEPTRAGLLRLAKAAGVNWPDALTALVAGYCRRFAGGEEMVVGVPHMGRMSAVAARVPAMVMNVLPLRVADREEAPLGDFLREVARATADARRHGRYRSEQLRRDLGLIGGSRRLYGPLVNVQPYDRPPRLAGLKVALHVTGTGPVDDIDFTFRGDAAHSLSIEVDSNPDLYSEAETVAHGRRLAEFLGRAVQAPGLADVPTATAAEADAEIRRWNATDHPVPDTTLVALVEERMRQAPDSEALRFAGRSMSYAELNRRSGALAMTLRERGVGGDAGGEGIVAVALPRSFELLVALVAILRAGGAWLPLDPDYPAGRVKSILDSAAPVAVLAEHDPHGLYGERLLPPALWPEQAAFAPVAVAPRHAAYVIYTSGSTGAPKGVLVEHGAIVNRLLWMAEHYGFTAADRILQKTPATFDVSVWEFFLPLLVGATLVIAPPDAHRDPSALAALVRSEGVTTLHFVPSMLAAFLDAPESAGLVATRVFVSGEELPAALRDRFHQRVTAELHNLYGPTEAAVDVSFWPAGPEDRSHPVPIGFPVWNTRLLLLDERMRPVPPGMTGHLYLGGVQLARGYLGQPDLTAERFVADPFHEGARLYKTGDLAHRRADGAVVFLGRADHQVKIRGLRIELGEIEAVLRQSGQVAAAVVVASDGHLLAYVVPEQGFDADAARAALRRDLPDYMVPSAIVPLAALPLSANGKLDRKALPKVEFESSGGETPATDTERRLADLYRRLLRRQDGISRTDDFFALGGDSLLAVQLMLRIRETFGHDPGLGTLFEHPDLATLAAKIDEKAALDGLAPLLTLTHGPKARPPLFLIHPAGGISWGYRTLARALSPQRTVVGVQAPMLAADAPLPSGIESLAADYAARIMAAAPSGLVHLGGWSVGGILAQAVAIELTARGREVGLVALFDSYPADCWRHEPEPTEAMALRALLAIAGHDPDAHPELAGRAEILAFLRRGGSTLGNLPAEALDGVIRTVLETNRLVRRHRHRRFPGTLAHVRAALDHKARPELQASLWQPYAARLALLEVPFLHSELTGAAASAAIAPLLDAEMAAFERRAA